MSLDALEQIKLDAKQKRMWEDTSAALAWCMPGFTHVYHTMMKTSGSEHTAVFTKEVPIAATDGVSMALNPDNFFRYTLMERVFIAGHEICHCIWNHCALLHDLTTTGRVRYSNGEELPFNHGLMNAAADGVINDMLMQSGKELQEPWGKLPQSLEVDGKPYVPCHFPGKIDRNMSVLDAYRVLYKEAKSQPKGGSGNRQGNEPGKGEGDQQGFDQHLKPGAVGGKDPEEAKQERNEGEWGAAVAAGMEAARLQGKLPASMERFFKEILNPQVAWQDHLKAEFKRRVAGSKAEWRRPDRRFIVRDIFAPSRSDYGCELVVVGCDTSGSISQLDFDVWIGEVSGMLSDCRPRRLLIAWCDARVASVDEVEDPEDLYQAKPKGGGGTSFVPVFDWIADEGLEPDVLVYLTDGHGEFPKEHPSYPVVWGSIDLPAKSYPFGDVVMIPKQVAA